MTSILDSFSSTRIVPVVVIKDVRHAAPLAQALKAGGLPLAEVTLRTPAAEDVIREMAQDPDLVVGAGSVLNPAQVERAAKAGAAFIVSPGLSPAVVGRAQELGLCVIPGVATSSEIMAALALGLTTLKFFPAEVLGGTAALRALAAPFPGVRFVPTGGVAPQNVVQYLTLECVLAVGGSWMVSENLLLGEDFAAVTALAADAVQAAKKKQDG